MRAVIVCRIHWSTFNAKTFTEACAMFSEHCRFFHFPQLERNRSLTGKTHNRETQKTPHSEV